MFLADDSSYQRYFRTGTGAVLKSGEEEGDGYLLTVRSGLQDETQPQPQHTCLTSGNHTPGEERKRHQ